MIQTEELSTLDRAALANAKSLAKSMEREFVNSDIPSHMQDTGIDLQRAAEVFLKTWHYDPDNKSTRFVTSVNSYFKRKGAITVAQARAILNVMRRELLNDSETHSVSSKVSEKLDCFICGELFETWDKLKAHKVSEHGSQPAPEVVAETGPAEEVLEVTESKKGLDLSNLPDGRYCAPDIKGKNDYIFFSVKRVRHTKEVDRRYRYGKIVTGREIVVAGTIEVRLWSSDAKEWIGQQKPNDVYRGKLEDELELVMMSPEPWALLFGKLSEYCSRCGKHLTDKESQEIGLGLECEKAVFRRGYFKKAPQYTFVGEDRPDKEKVNPYDSEYLKGTKRWIEPWECIEDHKFCNDHPRKLKS